MISPDRHFDFTLLTQTYVEEISLRIWLNILQHSSCKNLRNICPFFIMLSAELDLTNFPMLLTGCHLAFTWLIQIYFQEAFTGIRSNIIHFSSSRNLGSLKVIFIKLWPKIVNRWSWRSSMLVLGDNFELMGSGWILLIYYLLLIWRKPLLEHYQAYSRTDSLEI